MLFFLLQTDSEMMVSPQLPVGFGILILLFLLYQFFFKPNWSEKWNNIKFVFIWALTALFAIGLFWLMLSLV